MQKAVSLEINGLTLRGMLHEPGRNAPTPIAVLYHGFTGHKAEKNFLFVELSRALAAAGIASVRFDFSGSGESDGDFVGMTLRGEVAEAGAILDYAAALPFVDPSRVFLVGLSMGGAIASIVAGDRPEKVRAIVLWAPAGTMPALMAARETPANREALNAYGRVDLGGLLLGKAFFDDLATWDIYGRAAGFNGRVLLLHGDADETVPIEASLRYKEIYGGRAEMIAIPGADHTFNRWDWREEVIRRTVEYLRAESAG